MPRTLYLLAGNGGMARWWQDTLSHFERYRPEPIELPGFGENQEPPLNTLTDYADALVSKTSPGHNILACGVNALVVLHASVKHPQHFRHIILYGPIGAYLGERRLPRLLRNRMLQRCARFMLGHVFWPLQKLFTTQNWTPDQIKMVQLGYRRCRAFGAYFDMVQPASALSLFDQITNKITIVWGDQDAVADPRHAAAWEAILPQAKLRFSIQAEWGHYPYIDFPRTFVETLERLEYFKAHSKAGRLRLAQFAGIAVPEFAVTAEQRKQLLEQHNTARWMVRSSSASEDQWNQSNAGQSTSLMAVPTQNVERAIAQLTQADNEIILQRYIKPVVSGVAFVRYQSADIELVTGHLHALTQGQATPARLRLARIGRPWGNPVLPEHHYHGMSVSRCFDFLQQIVQRFHYAHLDIEWAWDGKQFWCFQLRPVTSYAWHRQLTSANIDEILPKQSSHLMEWAQRAAARSIVIQHAAWDPQVLRDNEPFTSLYQQASYINSDAFLFCLHRWGLPSRLYAHMVGGSAPTFDFNLNRFIRHIPLLLRMLFASRRQLKSLHKTLLQFEQELDQIEQTGNTKQQQLLNWFLRLYVFVVQSNLAINSAIASTFGQGVASAARFYKRGYRPHRVPFETDPASPRPLLHCPRIEGPVDAPWLTQYLLKWGLPWTKAHLFNTREWFRDAYTRLYFRLHHVLAQHEKPTPYWFEKHVYPRTLQGAFWQDEGVTKKQNHSVVIYPGDVRGHVGKDILIVDSLDPGQLHRYKTFKAVITRSGGSLSHGAILLRENAIPSAIIPDAPTLPAQAQARLQLNQLTWQS